MCVVVLLLSVVAYSADVVVVVAAAVVAFQPKGFAFSSDVEPVVAIFVQCITSFGKWYIVLQVSPA